MELAARFPRILTKKNSPSPLLAELADLKLQLDAACSQFDLLTDSDRIDACCYQIKSLKIRYDALLREARQQGLRREPLCIGRLAFPGKRSIMKLSDSRQKG